MASVEIWFLQVDCVRQAPATLPPPQSLSRKTVISAETAVPGASVPRHPAGALVRQASPFSKIAACLIRSIEMKTGQRLILRALN